ncbi:hypothetical protein F5Y06DRAFT_282603 [Hypoxylon sp. FL0890]|nr:hypothetical protein F5Y06DRAFT_282603 [Hypoxylon sp. FL0890]
MEYAVEFSSRQDLRASSSPAEKTRKTLAIEIESGGHPYMRPLKNTISNSVHRAGTFSTRSDTPSTVESVWDHSSAVYSAASPASDKEYFPPELELQPTDQCERRSDSDDSSSDLPRIPDNRLLMSNDSPSNGDNTSMPFRLCADNREYNISNGQKDRGANTTDRTRPEEACSELEDGDFDSDDEEHDDDEWGGEPDRIETAVLKNVEDLGFAAWLVVELHKDKAQTEAWRIGGWQKGVANCQKSPDSGENSQQTYGDSNGDRKSSRSHKRRRFSKSQERGSDDGDGEERDDGEGNGSPENHDDGSASGDPRGRYACPFNKSDPALFCSNPFTGDQYRVCESGYKTIQRLKEHIKRKHLLIQCERCYKNFSLKGKATEESLADLRRHRQQPEPCIVGNSEVNMGISVEQWTLLDKSGGKKRQKISEVQKWFIIWETIYPEKPHPPHPWAERTTLGIRPLPALANSQNFANLFQKFLDHGTMSGDIQFIPGQELLMKSRLNSLALRAYSVHTDLNDTPSLQNSSSSGQTTTQATLPVTPVIHSSNLASIAQRQMSGTKINRHGSQPLLMRDSQNQFSMLQPQIPTSISYGPQNFPSYRGSQIARVSPPVPGPPQALVLEQPDFDWSFGDMNHDWAGLQYPLQVESDNQDISYMQQNEQN